MANLGVLKNKIDSSSISVTEIASILGITRQGFYNKLNGKNDFRVEEVKKLSEILFLSKKEQLDIFFD